MRSILVRRGPVSPDGELCLYSIQWDPLPWPSALNALRFALAKVGLVLNVPGSRKRKTQDDCLLFTRRFADKPRRWGLAVWRIPAGLLCLKLKLLFSVLRAHGPRTMTPAVAAKRSPWVVPLRHVSRGPVPLSQPEEAPCLLAAMGTRSPCDSQLGRALFCLSETFVCSAAHTFNMCAA